MSQIYVADELRGGGSRVSHLVLALGELLDDLAQKAGRSSGSRLETRPWSQTTSSSTQLPPALTMSVLMLG